MNEFFELIVLAALIVLLLRLPGRTLLVVAAVCAALWLLGFWGPGRFCPMPHWGAMHFAGAHFWPAPHLRHGLFAVAVIAGFVWLIHKAFGSERSQQKDKVEDLPEPPAR